MIIESFSDRGEDKGNIYPKENSLGCQCKSEAPRLLLINPPYTMADTNMWKKINPRLPPLGLGYIASFLQEKGVGVRILDVAAENLDIPGLKVSLKEWNPDFIGITAVTVVIKAALGIASICKETLPNTKIIMGGVHSTIFPEEVLTNYYIDYVVRREGEFTVLELLRNGSPVSVAGLSYRTGSKIIHNPCREFIEDLDSLPHPAYHLLPMDKYKPSTGNYKRLPAASIITSRGCPGRCTFCYTGVFGKHIRFRSADNIINEVRLLKKKYKIREVSFYDDTFTANKSNVLKLCELLRKEKLDISWSCMSRIDRVDSPLLKEMKSAGCHQIGYGIESADEDILVNIKKPMSLVKIKEVVRKTQKEGIDVRGMFMFGNPGETEETMEKTLKFAVNLDCDMAVFNITTPYPGTEMFNWAKEQGYLDTFEWGKYDLSRCTMNLPTIRPERVEYFYRKAYRVFYLRQRYLIKKLFKIHSLTDIRMYFGFFFSMVKEWINT